MALNHLLILGSYFGLLFVFFTTSASSTRADDAKIQTHHFETYSGFAYEGTGFASYSAAVWSPFTDVSKEGFRIRTGNLTSIYGDGANRVFSGAFAPKSSLTVSDAELGYQFNYNWLWFKVYAGGALQTDLKLWRQIAALRQEQGWGAKVSVETWSKLSDRTWLSVNVSWLDIGQSTSLYMKAGYDLVKLQNGMTVAVGLDASVNRYMAQTMRRLQSSGQEVDYVSGGAFANLRYGVHDLSVSGGLSQSDNDNGELKPHLTITYGRQF